MSHPSVIAVHDFGVDPEGGPYYTMAQLLAAIATELRISEPDDWESDD